MTLHVTDLVLGCSCRFLREIHLEDYELDVPSHAGRLRHPPRATAAAGVDSDHRDGVGAGAPALHHMVDMELDAFLERTQAAVDDGVSVGEVRRLGAAVRHARTPPFVTCWRVGVVSGRHRGRC